MSNWITDRLPTRADADEWGLVLVRHLGLKSSQVIAHWSNLAGAEWRHTSDWTPPTPEPTPAAPEIPEPIRTGAAPFYVVVISNNCPSTGGEPIVLQHPISRQTTLQAALQRQDSIGHRYGTTYIAECRIIAETELPRVL